MKRRWPSGLVLATLVCLTGSVSAETDGEVRVYTNADIERLAPLPSQKAPIVRFDKERWEYVVQFLEREHERLDADRKHDLDRAILDAEIEAAEPAPRYGLAYAPYTHQGFYRRPHRAAPVRRQQGSDAAGRITPLHARPNLARQAFDKANP